VMATEVTPIGGTWGTSCATCSSAPYRCYPRKKNEETLFSLWPFPQPPFFSGDMIKQMHYVMDKRRRRALLTNLLATVLVSSTLKLFILAVRHAPPPPNPIPFIGSNLSCSCWVARLKRGWGSEVAPRQSRTTLSLLKLVRFRQDIWPSVCPNLTSLVIKDWDKVARKQGSPVGLWRPANEAEGGIESAEERGARQRSPWEGRDLLDFDSDKSIREGEEGRIAPTLGTTFFLPFPFPSSGTNQPIQYA